MPFLTSFVLTSVSSQKDQLLQPLKEYYLLQCFKENNVLQPLNGYQGLHLVVPQNENQVYFLLKASSVIIFRCTSCVNCVAHVRVSTCCYKSRNIFIHVGLMCSYRTIFCCLLCKVSIIEK